jgi:hypothetical protein
VLGPKLAQLVTDGYSRRAGAAYARSLVPGADLSDEEEMLARELEAALEAMYLMANADGDLAADELMLLSTTLRDILETCAGGTLSSAELGLPVLKLSETVEKFSRSLATEGLDARVSSVARRIKAPAGKSLAFRLAGGVAFVDEVVESGEVASLDQLGEALGLSSREQLELLRDVLTVLR